MFDHQLSYSTGFRDVIAAWLVCAAVAVTAFAYSAVAAAPEIIGVEARAVPPAPPMKAICIDRVSPVERPLG